MKKLHARQRGVGIVAKLVKLQILTATPHIRALALAVPRPVQFPVDFPSRQQMVAHILGFLPMGED